MLGAVNMPTVKKFISVNEFDYFHEEAFLIKTPFQQSVGYSFYIVRKANDIKEIRLEPRFFPAGSTGTRRLVKLFHSRKYPISRGDRFPLVKSPLVKLSQPYTVPQLRYRNILFR